MRPFLVTIRTAILVATAAFTPAGAQQTYVNILGTIMRYHGDTIWMERDTTVTRSIYSGDTVTTLNTLNGELRSEMRMVIRGDSAYVIESRSASGQVRKTPAGNRAVPIEVALMLRRLLESEARNSGLMGVVRKSGAGASMEPPLAPDTAVRYDVSPELRMIQHRDTVHVLRGCPSASVDTSTFLLYGADSTRRITAPAKSYGPAMALSLIGHMRQVLIERQANAYRPALPPDFPHAPAACGRNP